MLEVTKREQVIVTPDSPGRMVVVDRPQRVVVYVGGGRGPKGGIWSSYDEIPGKPNFDALYDPIGAAASAQSSAVASAALDATAKADTAKSEAILAAAFDTEARLEAHEASADPHPQYQTQVENDARYSQLGHNHAGVYDPAGSAATAQAAAIAAAAADATAKANAAQTAAIDTLRAGVSADGDTLAKLRSLIQGIETLLTSDNANLDTLQEVVDFVELHQSSLDSLGTGKVNVSDIINVLTDASTNKPLSAAQGKVLKDLLDALTTVVAGKEPAIAASSTANYWRGDKTWRRFATDVLAAVLTGLSTASATVVAASDSVLVAIGKLQAQISDIVTQVDAETGTSTARKSWTAQRVRQAAAAWWLTASSAFGRTLIGVANEAAGRTALGLGSASVLAAGQADAALPTNSDIRAYYGSKFNPGVLPTFEMDFENARFSLYDAGDSGVYSTSRHFDEFAAWFGTDMQITRASTQTYFDALGNMREAPEHTVRCDHDPLTGQRLGPYIGSAKTAYFLYSTDVSNAAWWKTRSFVTPNAYTALDGTLTAGKLVESTDLGWHYIRQGNTLTAGVTYCVAFCVVAAERTKVKVKFPNSSAAWGTDRSATFDLAAGTVIATSGTLTAAGIINLGQGRYVCYISATAVATGTGEAYLSLLDAGGATDYTGDGTSGVYVLYGNLTNETTPSPLIVTAGSTVTRPATTITISGAKFSGMFNAVQGTFVLQYNKPMREAQVGTAMSVGDGTTQNRMYFLINNSVATVFDYFEASAAGVGQGRTGDVSTTVGRAAFSYATNNVAVGKNGVSYTDSTFAVPVVNKLDLGHRDGAAQINGHLTSVTYYPVALSTTPVVELAK